MADAAAAPRSRPPPDDRPDHDDGLRQFKKDLYQQLNSAGVVNALKSQLRSQLLAKLRCGPDALVQPAVKEKGLRQLAMDSLVSEYLWRQGYQYSLSVFQPEAGLAAESQLTREDILQALGMQRLVGRGARLPTAGGQGAQGGGGGSGSLLAYVVSGVEQLGLGPCASDAAAQTDDSPATQLARQLQHIDASYSSALQRGGDGGSGSGGGGSSRDAGALQAQQQRLARLEQRFEEEVDRKVALLRESWEQEARTRQGARCSAASPASALAHEAAYQERLHALHVREQQALERLAAQQAAAYEERQAALAAQQRFDAWRQATEAEIRDLQARAQAKVAQVDARSREADEKAAAAADAIARCKAIARGQVEEEYAERAAGLARREAAVKAAQAAVQQQAAAAQRAATEGAAQARHFAAAEATLREQVRQLQDRLHAAEREQQAGLRSVQRLADRLQSCHDDAAQRLEVATRMLRYWQETARSQERLAEEAVQGHEAALQQVEELQAALQAARRAASSARLQGAAGRPLTISAPCSPARAGVHPGLRADAQRHPVAAPGGQQAGVRALHASLAAHRKRHALQRLKSLRGQQPSAGGDSEGSPSPSATALSSPASSSCCTGSGSGGTPSSGGAPFAAELDQLRRAVRRLQKVSGGAAPAQHPDEHPRPRAAKQTKFDASTATEAEAPPAWLAELACGTPSAPAAAKADAASAAAAAPAAAPVLTNITNSCGAAASGEAAKQPSPPLPAGGRSSASSPPPTVAAEQLHSTTTTPRTARTPAGAGGTPASPLPPPPVDTAMGKLQHVQQWLEHATSSQPSPEPAARADEHAAQGHAVGEDEEMDGDAATSADGGSREAGAQQPPQQQEAGSDGGDGGGGGSRCARSVCTATTTSAASPIPGSAGGAAASLESSNQVTAAAGAAAAADARAQTTPSPTSAGQRPEAAELPPWAQARRALYASSDDEDDDGHAPAGSAGDSCGGEAGARARVAVRGDAVACAAGDSCSSLPEVEEAPGLPDILATVARLGSAVSSEGSVF